MEENSSGDLDLEFKKYLQMMRPYLGQLDDETAINICNAWINRLSNCSETEKPRRNKCVSLLSYQLAKGILDEPFLKYPSKEGLPFITQTPDSENSSEINSIDLNDVDSNTKILYNSNTSKVDTKNCSKHYESERSDSETSTINDSFEKSASKIQSQSSKTQRKHNLQCYTCPNILRTHSRNDCEDFDDRPNNDLYEQRANNLIFRLREIKKQNMLLHNELINLRQESKIKSSCESLQKVNAATSTLMRTESGCTIQSLKKQLKSIEEDKKHLLKHLESLQEHIDNYEEIKKRDIEDIQAKHKVEIAKIKSSLRDENKIMYEERLEQLKDYYENLIEDIKKSFAAQNSLTCKKETSLEIEKVIQEKNREVYQKCQEVQEKLLMIQQKTQEIEEKDKIIEAKDAEIAHLKGKVLDEKTDLHNILNKLLEKQDKPSQDGNSECWRLKAQELENRLAKMDRSKAKFLKSYEAKIACLQREKHLAECSLQLQLVRQRTQVVNETSEEHQTELNDAIEKLEAKYKEIVANVQSTALEKRRQDEMSINAIIKTACSFGLKNDILTNHGKSMSRQPHEGCQSGDSEITENLLRAHMNSNQSYVEGETPRGYCLDGEKFSELMGKLHIPQRDFPA